MSLAPRASTLAALIGALGLSSDDAERMLAAATVDGVHPSIVLLSGTRGIGKTTTAMERPSCAPTSDTSTRYR